MMPGESQPKTVAIAADATAGNCQNCSVLHQSLTEYVSSLLALKQKITISDDTIRLQQHLKELQIRLVTLEKKTKDYECVQAELEEKKHTLKGYENLSEETEKVRQENNRIVAEKKKLEDQLKRVKEAQKLENSQLRTEKVIIENDLLQTQASLKKFQTQAEKVDKLMEENSKMTSIKDSLEHKVRNLEDLVSEQNHQLSQLTKENSILERNINDLQVRLMILERERIKGYRSTSTQTTVPEEPKIDKERIKMLLHHLWACVEPGEETMNLQQFTESSQKQVLLSSSPKEDSHESKMPLSASHRIIESTSCHVPAKAIHTVSKLTSEAQNSTNNQESPRRLKGKKRTKTPKKVTQSATEDRPDKLPSDPGSAELSVKKIFALFKPLPPCLSPILDIEVDPMDIDNKETETNPKPPGASLPPAQESLHATIQSSGQENSKTCPNPVKENVDMEVVTTKDAGHISNEPDSENSDQNVLRTQMKEQTEVDTENKWHQKVMEPEQEPASVQSVLAPSHSPQSSLEAGVPVESFPITAVCVNSPSKTEENSSEESKKDQSGDFVNMDLDTSSSDGTIAEPIIPDDRESQRGSGATVISSEATIPLVTSTTVSNNLKDAKVPNTKGVSGEKKSKDMSACKIQEKMSYNKDTEMLGDGVKDRPETVAPIRKDSNGAQETGSGDGTFSPLKSDDDCGSLLLMVATKLKEDEKHGQANITAPSTKEVNSDNEMMPDEGPFLTDSQEIHTVTSEPLKADTQCVCEQLSPKGPSPPINQQPLKIHADSEKFNADVDLGCISKNKKAPAPNSEEEGIIERAIVKDFPQDRIDAGSAASLNHNAAPTLEQKQSLEVCEKQSSDSIAEKKPSTETTAAQSTLCIWDIRSEVGLPLPPILTPVNTPPKVGKSINPRHAIGKLLFPSPMDSLSSPTTPVKALLTPSQQLRSSSLNSPVPLNGVPSSPLQFGSATPKHAVPVPGRLPTTAMNSSPSSSSSLSQENSMRILDSMYPELSARARTLSILRGNVSLSVCPSESGSMPTAADNQMSSFKTVNSTSTAFTKTEARGEKRPAASFPQPGSKCIRLDSSSASVSRQHVLLSSTNRAEERTSSSNLNLEQPKNETNSKSEETRELTEQNLIVNCLKKIENECFDLMPVIRSHIHVGNLPAKPVLRDEEKKVISQICQSNSDIADEMLLAIRNKLKAEKQNLSRNYMQALCRVYTGICRQKRYQDKAHLLAYDILAEDFPRCAQLVLFMVTTWPTVLSHSSSLCQTIHTITKLKANKDLRCLSAFLDWDQSPPCDIDHLISRTMAEIRSGSNLSFTKHIRYGDDLSEKAWEHVFTLQLLCSYKKWKWTYENLLGKELWPIMNTWVTQPRDQQEPVSDVTVATVLRLIGRLCQLGLKEGCATNVGTVANVINTFGRHGHTEGVPWVVQLAAVYCIHELSPYNPKHALEALAGWRAETSQSVPPAVTSCMNQLASVCRQVKS